MRFRCSLECAIACMGYIKLNEKYPMKIKGDNEIWWEKCALVRAKNSRKHNNFYFFDDMNESMRKIEIAEGEMEQAFMKIGCKGRVK